MTEQHVKKDEDKELKDYMHRMIDMMMMMMIMMMIMMMMRCRQHDLIVLGIIWSCWALFGRAGHYLVVLGMIWSCWT